MQITLDYEFSPVPRYGYGKAAHPQLYRVIDANRETFVDHLCRFRDFRPGLARIPLEEDPDDDLLPFWNNGFFPGLDAVSLYCFLCMNRPAVFCEIGSGHSTRFARHAIRSHGLPTRIVSIDPDPRVHVDSLCDVVIRRAVEDIDLELLDDLGAGDILFVDSSHRSFMNSDVTTLCLDVLPRLRAGVIVHFHDVFLPYDYPAEWGDRFYNEQYLLACSLLAHKPSFEIVLANVFINCDPQLNASVEDLFDHPSMADIAADGWIVGSGWSFWMRKL